MNSKKMFIGGCVFLGIIFLGIFLTGSCVFGHSWKEATCLKPQTCSKCGKTTGEPLGHQLSEASCTKASKCKLCGKTVGHALGHDVEYNNVIKIATCKEEGETSGVCKRCGELLNHKIPATGEHNIVWENEIPTCSGGTRKGKCSICGYEKEEQIDGTGLHVFGEWFQSGINESGLKPMAIMKRVCTLCGAEEEKLEAIDYKQILTDNITITNIFQDIRSYDNKTLHGAEYTIKNNTNIDFQFVKIRITLLDGNNNAITSYSDYLSNGADLPAGELKQGSIKMPYEGIVENIKLSIDDLTIKKN